MASTRTKESVAASREHDGEPTPTSAPYAVIVDDDADFQAAMQELVRTAAIPAYEQLGITLVGAFETAMCNEAECVLLWAFPTWASWGEFEASQRSDAAVRAWRDATRGLVVDWQRTLMVDAPFSPMRIGRQPEVGDRAHGPK